MDDLVLPGEAVDDAPRSSVAYYGENGRLRLAAGDGTFHDPAPVAGLGTAEWEPAHLDADGSIDLAGFEIWMNACERPPCRHFRAPLLSTP